MKTVRTLVLVAGLGLPVLALGMSLSGCDKASDAPAPASGTSNPKGHGHTHADGAGHDHDHDHAKGDGHDHGHSHGPATALGEQAAGGFTVKASREGDVPPGGEATFDVSITGGTAAPAAVRLWVGTQDAKGSTKAKADAEKDGWHGHVEVPKPLPADSKLWVEIESAGGEKTVVGFDLKL